MNSHASGALRPRTAITASLAALTLIVACSAGSAVSSSARAQRLAELRGIAEELRAAVLAEDIEKLLKYDPRNAELDEPVPPERWSVNYGFYEADRLLLLDRRSWLYCEVFDSSCLRQLARKPSGAKNPFMRVSIKEFLAGPLEVRIVFYADERGSEVLEAPVILYIRDGSRVQFPKTIRNAEEDLPIDRWGLDFVAAAFRQTKRGWRYDGRMFSVWVQ